MRGRICGFLFLAATAAGCSSANSVGDKVTVTGRVLLGDEPLPGARVRFVEGTTPEAEASGPTAITGDDGQYRIAWVKPADYKVVVCKYVSPPGSPPETDAEVLEMSGRGKNMLPAKYASAFSTPLTATVKAGAGAAVDLKVERKK